MSEAPPAPPGWYPDPAGSGEQRYWDGSRWADQTPPPQGGQSTGAALRDVALVRHESKWEFAKKLMSLRLMAGAMTLGLLTAIPLALIWDPLAWLGLLVAVAVWWLAAATPGYVLYCPHCRKRVKAGASVCHHCGRQTS